ncbi:MAG: hypothetical protein ACFFCO_12680 [Promethearchaeota archaeon]
MDNQPDGTTINFNIIVKDMQNNEAVRGSYYFLWQDDKWGPQVEEVGIEPGHIIDVHKSVKMSVFAQDVPSQGSVRTVSIHYSEVGKEEVIKPLTSIDNTFWGIEFDSGFDRPLSLVYYYVAIDDKGNPGASISYSLLVTGRAITIPLELVVIALFTVILVVPTGLYFYAERKKKQARTKIREIKQNKRMVRTGQKSVTGSMSKIWQKRGTRRE